MIQFMSWLCFGIWVFHGLAWVITGDRPNDFVIGIAILICALHFTESVKEA